MNEMSKEPLTLEERFREIFKNFNLTFEREIDAQEFMVDEDEWRGLIKTLCICQDEALAALTTAAEEAVREAFKEGCEAQRENYRLREQPIAAELEHKLKCPECRHMIHVPCANYLKAELTDSVKGGGDE